MKLFSFFLLILFLINIPPALAIYPDSQEAPAQTAQNEERRKLHEKLKPEYEKLCNKLYAKVYELVTTKDFDQLSPEDIKTINSFTILNNLSLCTSLFKKDLKRLEKDLPSENKLNILIDWPYHQRYDTEAPPGNTVGLYNFLKHYALVHRESCRVNNDSLDELLTCLAGNGTYFVPPLSQDSLIESIFLLKSRYPDKINLIVFTDAYPSLKFGKEIRKMDQYLKEKKYPLCAILNTQPSGDPLLICSPFNLERTYSSFTARPEFNPKYLMIGDEKDTFVIGFKQEISKEYFNFYTKSGFDYLKLHNNRFQIILSGSDEIWKLYQNDMKVVSNAMDKVKKKKITVSEAVLEIQSNAKTLFCTMKVEGPYAIFAVKLNNNSSTCNNEPLEYWKIYYRSLSEIIKWFEKEFRPRGLL